MELCERRGGKKGRMVVIVRKLSNGRKKMEERKKTRGEEIRICNRNTKSEKY